MDLGGAFQSCETQRTLIPTKCSRKFLGHDFSAESSMGQMHIRNRGIIRSFISFYWIDLQFGFDADSLLLQLQSCGTSNTNLCKKRFHTPVSLLSFFQHLQSLYFSPSLNCWKNFLFGWNILILSPFNSEMGVWMLQKYCNQKCSKRVTVTLYRLIWRMTWNQSGSHQQKSLMSNKLPLSH